MALTVKALYWDQTGFYLWLKRLEQQKFKWPLTYSSETMRLSESDWSRLLLGYDILGHPPDALPGGKSAWVEVRSDKFSYPYDIVLDGVMVWLSNSVFTQFKSFISRKKFKGVGSTGVNIPTNSAMKRTSSYRNPERNERVGGDEERKHMLSRAADIAVVGHTKDSRGSDKATKFYTMWKSVLANQPDGADRIHLEPSPGNPIIYANKVGSMSRIGYQGNDKEEIFI